MKKSTIINYPLYVAQGTIKVIEIRRGNIEEEDERLYNAEGHCLKVKKIEENETKRNVK